MGLTTPDAIALGSLFISLAAVAMTLISKLISARLPSMKVDDGNGQSKRVAVLHSPLPECLEWRQSMNGVITQQYKEIQSLIRCHQERIEQRLGKSEVAITRLDGRFDQMMVMLQQTSRE